MMLKNKIAIITGSTDGIGKGILEYMASMGAHVIITSRNIQKAQRMADDIIERGLAATPCRFELKNPSTGRALIKQVLEKHGQINILVNNAISRPTPSSSELLDDPDNSKLQEYITTNIANVLALTLHCYPHLKNSKGCVLNIGSVVTNRHIMNTLLYGVVKGALTQMTKALAAEWAKDDIRINQINPGFVLTDAFKKQIPEEILPNILEKFKQHHPIDRLGNPLDIGALSTFMVSDELSWMTGSVVDIDGGYSVQGMPNPFE